MSTSKLECCKCGLEIADEDYILVPQKRGDRFIHKDCNIPDYSSW